MDDKFHVSLAFIYIVETGSFSASAAATGVASLASSAAVKEGAEFAVPLRIRSWCSCSNDIRSIRYMVRGYGLKCGK